MSSLKADSVDFTEFKLEEDGTTSLLVKKGEDTKATFNVNGILYDNTSTDITADNVQSAITELDTAVKQSVQSSGGGRTSGTYVFNDSTSDADPTSGQFSLNNVTPASVTKLFLNNLENENDSNLRALFTAQTGRTQVYIQKSNDCAIYALYDAQGMNTGDSDYLKINNLEYVTGVGFTPVNGDIYTVMITRKRGFVLAGKDVPALPLDDTGDHKVIYDSATQSVSWEVDAGGTGTPGGSNTEIQYNDSGSLEGLSTLTTDGTHLTMDGGNIKLNNSDDLVMGDSSNYFLQHTGTQLLGTNTTGPYLHVNSGTSADDNVTYQLGTSTDAVRFRVINAASHELLRAPASGEVTSYNRIMERTTATELNNGSDMTYPAFTIVGGVIVRDCASAARNDLFDTAANIVTALKDPLIGRAFKVIIENASSDPAETITMTTNTGLTLFGGVDIPQGKSREFLFRCTNAVALSEAFDVYDLTGALSSDALPPTYSQDSTTVTLNASGKLDLDDDAEIRVGTGDDLKISHAAGTTLFENNSTVLKFSNSASFHRIENIIGTSMLEQFQIRDSGDDLKFAVWGSGLTNCRYVMNIAGGDYEDSPIARVDVAQSTFTDSGTSVSGTALLYPVVRIRQQTLAATNNNVTTNEAASLYIDNAVGGRSKTNNS